MHAWALLAFKPTVYERKGEVFSQCHGAEMSIFYVIVQFNGMHMLHLHDADFDTFRNAVAVQYRGCAHMPARQVCVQRRVLPNLSLGY